MQQSHNNYNMLDVSRYSCMFTKDTIIYNYAH